MTLKISNSAIRVKFYNSVFLKKLTDVSALLESQEDNKKMQSALDEAYRNLSCLQARVTVANFEGANTVPAYKLIRPGGHPSKRTILPKIRLTGQLENLDRLTILVM